MGAPGVAVDRMTQDETRSDASTPGTAPDATSREPTTAFLVVGAPSAPAGEGRR